MYSIMKPTTNANLNAVGKTLDNTKVGDVLIPGIYAYNLI